MRFSKVVVVLCFNVFVLAVIVSCAELITRTVAPRSADALFSDDGIRLRGRPFVQRDREIGFALMPGYENQSTGYRINSNGFRGADLPPDLQRFDVVLAMGDSTTFGWRVAAGADYPTQLQTLLGRGSVLTRPYVINAGVPSYTSSQVLLLLRRLLPELRPRVVVVSVMWNDIWFAAIPNWYPELLIAKQPSALIRFLTDHSGVYRAFTLSASAEELTIDGTNKRAHDFYRENLQAMVDACERAGTQLVFMHAPFSLDHVKASGLDMRKLGLRFTPGFLFEISRSYRATASEVFSRRGIPVVDHQLAGENPHHPEWFVDLLHPNRLGYSIIAGDLAATLATLSIARADGENEAVSRPGRLGPPDADR